MDNLGGSTGRFTGSDGVLEGSSGFAGDGVVLWYAFVHVPALSLRVSGHGEVGREGASAWVFFLAGAGSGSCPEGSVLRISWPGAQDALR